MFYDLHVKLHLNVNVDASPWSNGAVCLTCEEPPAGAAEDAEQGGAQVLVQEQEQQGVDDGVHEGHVQGNLKRG